MLASRNLRIRIIRPQRLLRTLCRDVTGNFSTIPCSIVAIVLINWRRRQTSIARSSVPRASLFQALGPSKHPPTCSRYSFVSPITRTLLSGTLFPVYVASPRHSLTGDTPTYLAAPAAMWPKSGAAIAPNVGNISVTTTTISPVISGVTPNAATTTYNAEMDIDVECNGQISPSNCGHSTQANLYIMGFTGNVLDPIVLKRGTACYVLP